jgi:hypothetical protein
MNSKPKARYKICYHAVKVQSYLILRSEVDDYCLIRASSLTADDVKTMGAVSSVGGSDESLHK